MFRALLVTSGNGRILSRSLAVLESGIPDKETLLVRASRRLRRELKPEETEMVVIPNSEYNERDLAHAKAIQVQGGKIRGVVLDGSPRNKQPKGERE